MQIDPLLAERTPHFRPESERHEGEDPGELRLGYNPQLNEHHYDPDLHHERRQNRYKLQRRFEHLFAKYERNFEGIGDEIDLQTGDIVVNNGHIKNMRHEGDTGARTLQGSMSHIPEGSVTGSYDTDQEETSTHTSDGASDVDQLNVLDQNDNATLSTSVVDELTSDGEFAKASSYHQPTQSAMSSRNTPTMPYFGFPTVRTTQVQILHHVPALQESMEAMRMQSLSGQTIDSDAINAFGISIAKQLSDYISQNSMQAPEPFEAASSATGSAWTYPSLPGHTVPDTHQRKSTKRGSRRLPPLLSPTRQSLWAPVKYPSARKSKSLPSQHVRSEPQRNGNGVVDPAYPAVPAAKVVEPLQSNTPQRPPPVCENCGYEGDGTWRLGEKRERLCNACGMYLYRYGLSRPITSAQEVESDLTPEPHSDVDSVQVNVETDSPASKPNSAFRIDEDSLLIRLKEIDLLHWDAIAAYFPGRSPYAVQCRYSKKLCGRDSKARTVLIDKGFECERDTNGIRMVPPALNGPFTDEEDDLLLKLLEEEGLDWDAIALRLGGRGPQAVEQRYYQIARDCLGRRTKDPFLVDPMPAKKPAKSSLRVAYTKEEDEQILYLREREKKSWLEIAEHFPSRKQGSLQKRYKRDLRPVKKNHSNIVSAARSRIDIVDLLDGTPSSQLQGVDMGVSIDNGLTFDPNVAATQPLAAGVDSDAQAPVVGPTVVEKSRVSASRQTEDRHDGFVAPSVSDGSDKQPQVFHEDVSCINPDHANHALEQARAVPADQINNHLASLSGGVNLSEEALEHLDFTLKEAMVLAFQSHGRRPITTADINEWIEHKLDVVRDRTTSIRKALNAEPEFEKVGHGRPQLWRYVERQPAQVGGDDDDSVIAVTDQRGLKRGRETHDTPARETPAKRAKVQDSSLLAPATTKSDKVIPGRVTPRTAGKKIAASSHTLDKDSTASVSIDPSLAPAEIPESPQCHSAPSMITPPKTSELVKAVQRKKGIQNAGPASSPTLGQSASVPTAKSKAALTNSGQKVSPWLKPRHSLSSVKIGGKKYWRSETPSGTPKVPRIAVQSVDDNSDDEILH